MPVTNVTTDPQALTMTIVADFPVPVRKLWDAYADPRQFERFWGPVDWPATFTRHDMTPGGESRYHMTGPEGERAPGWFEFLSVTEGERFEVLDGFARQDGTRDPDTPVMRMVFGFEPTETGSRLTMTTYFDSLSDLESIMDQGMEEGTLSAMGQMDAVLADLRSFALGQSVRTQLLGDRQARLSRIIRGDADAVWRAHHDPELLRRWQLGPDGWTMPVCEVGTAVGDTYRTEWAPEDGGEGFGFTGTVLATDPPRREVTTESMIDQEQTVTTNEMTLTPVDGGTLLTLVVTYPDADLRERVLGTGMAEGMEASYARLEAEVLA